MKKIIASIAIFTLLFIFSSCADKTNNALIIGSWNGVEWLVSGQPSENDASKTSFTFDDKGKYSFNYGGTVEKGTYKVENNMLFTTPEKQQEIMVYIAKLTADTLVFDMNRGGQPETLTLLRKK